MTSLSFLIEANVVVGFGSTFRFQRSSRLITGISGSCIEDVVPVVTTAPPTAAEIGDPVGGRASPSHLERGSIVNRARNVPDVSRSDNMDRDTAALGGPCCGDHPFLGALE